MSDSCPVPDAPQGEKQFDELLSVLKEIAEATQVIASVAATLAATLDESLNGQDTDEGSKIDIPQAL